MKTTKLFKSILILSATMTWMSAADTQKPPSRFSPEAMKVVKIESASRLVAPSATAVRLVGRKAPVPVTVSAHKHEFTFSRTGAADWPLHLVEFEVKSSDAESLAWFYWDSADAYPRDFKLFTSDNASYACYCTSHGVKIFRITAHNESQVARQLFLEKQVGVGEFGTLRIGFMRESVGAEVFQTTNALYSPTTVVNVYEVDSTLHVTLYGNDPAHKFTFAFRGNQWHFVGKQD